MTYALIGGLVVGGLLVLLSGELFPSPTDRELLGAQIEPWHPKVVEPSVDDYQGSVGQLVARGHGPVRTVVSGALKVIARHVRVVWERPSTYVRRHRKGGGYYDTLHAYGAMVVSDILNPYRARHYEGVNA
jgi:hypothetical protein